MNLYHIKDWQSHFETNETRKLSKLRWWPKPNKHDGLGYRRMASQKNRCELYAAWNLIADIASKTTPTNRRGYLERGGIPLSAEDMGLTTGFPAEIFERALLFFASPEIQWLCVESAGTPGNVPGTPGNPPAVLKEEKEKNEEKECYHRDSRTVLFYLKEATGTNFREVDSNLKFISQRLKEPDVTLDGIKLMIDRQCRKWKGTEWEQYLQPSTLFNETKFESYYAAREQPILTNDKPEKQKHHFLI